MEETIIDLSHPGYERFTRRLAVISQYFSDTTTLLLPGQTIAQQITRCHQSYLAPTNSGQRLVLELTLCSQCPIGFSLWHVSAEALQRVSAGIITPTEVGAVRREVHGDEDGAVFIQLVAFEPRLPFGVRLSVSVAASPLGVAPAPQRSLPILGRLWEHAKAPPSELMRT
jgi:hypothetical protein